MKNYLDWLFPDSLSSLDDPQSRLSAAWEIAHRAGGFLLHDRPQDLKVSSKSSASDLVSAMDREAEMLIVETIRSRYPHDGILGEEGADVESENGIRWIIDPLDGTVNYLFGLPMWGVSIAIEVAGIVHFGVVAIPALGHTYVGVKGGGAYRFETAEPEADVLGELLRTQIYVRRTPEFSRALVATGFGYGVGRRVKQAEVVQALIARIADIRRGGAAVVDFCWLANGYLDAYYEYGLNPWDYAAGALIAAEAGAIVGGLDTDDFSEFMIAASPDAFDDLRLALKELGAHELLHT